MEAGLAAHVRVVGQDDYDGVEGGAGEFYSSAIVMRKGEKPASGSYAGLRLAYNSPDSMSGYLALKRDLERQGAGLDVFAERIISGGHRHSLRMVASGAADVMAIDCKSWALAKQYEPAARELAVVGWTTKRLGLPFVMADGR
jgi:ABC-type phosphate/phosphonate transport system substrate-binding protein